MDHYNIPKMPGEFAGEHPVLNATNIPAGAIVALNAAGNAVPASSAITGFAIGRAAAGVDNPGAIGDKSVLVERGVFSLALDATNPPNKSHVGGLVYFTAPDTVSSLNTVTCRGGILIGFDEEGRALVDLTMATKTAGL